MDRFLIQIATLGCMLLVSIPAVWASPQTDLWQAAEIADQAGLAKALRAGANANATDQDGWSALLFAATSGNLSVVSRLLVEHADPNLASKDGQTPLMGAVVGGNAAVVKKLLAAGAHAGSRLPSGKTAADLARSLGRADIVKLLAKSETRDAIEAVETAPAVKMAASSPDAGTSKKVGGVSDETIRAFLVEQSSTDNKLQQIKQQQSSANKGIAEAYRKKMEITQIAQQQYRDCLGRIDQCKKNCSDTGDTEIISAGIAGAILGRAGANTGNAAMSAYNSAVKADACAANCDTSISCESVRPR
ncbi:MAG: ankyrin repeat domain-containing protein [Georgfuchsia sp.]